VSGVQHRQRRKVRIGSPVRCGVLLLAALLAVISGCSPAAVAGRAANDAQLQAGAPAPADRPQDGPVSCPAATVQVGTTGELRDALANAAPGITIGIADGTYDGEFNATASGTAQAPIWLCGSRQAVLRGFGTDQGAVLHLQQVGHWRLVGFSVRQGEKGVLTDGVTDSVLQDLTVTDIGDEAVHLRSGSSGNVLRGLTISDTGLREEKFGEGIYVGSAVGNWCQISGCEPDRSDGNIIVHSTISDTAAESIDIKEGTTGGVVQDNVFDGAGLRGDADSWVDDKGNGWVIRDNHGTSARGSGFEVHRLVQGWGTGNVFDGNSADVRGSGYGFELHPIADNRVTCSNSAVDAARGLTNTTCG
jgi:hypothetical protein